jgi:hypothetical protein
MAPSFETLERNDVDGAMEIYRELVAQPLRVRWDVIGILTKMQDDPAEFRARMAAEPLPDPPAPEVSHLPPGAEVQACPGPLLRVPRERARRAGSQSPRPLSEKNPLTRNEMFDHRLVVGTISRRPHP